MQNVNIAPAGASGIILGGIAVKRVGSTIFIPLPRELWKPFSDADPGTGLGPCCCRYCSPVAGESRPAGAWDTLAVSIDKRRKWSAGHTWMVHAPEYHGVRPKRRRNASREVV